MEISRHITGDIDLRGAFRHLPSPVVVVAALVDGAPVGMTMSSFVSVSLNPALVSFCPTVGSRTWALLRDAPVLGVSVLSADQGEVGRLLARREGDRFAGVDWRATEGGAVLLGGSAIELEAELATVHPAGDHEIVLVSPTSVALAPERTAVVFHRGEFVAPAQAAAHRHLQAV